MKVKTRNKIVTVLLLTLLAAVLSMIGVIYVGSTTVFAAGNTNVQTLTGTEAVTHTALNNYSTTYFESYSFNTGIKIYGLLNTGINSSGNEIKVDGNAVTIDFSNATALPVPTVESYYFPPSATQTGYTFQILNGSTVKWYATVTRSTYTKQVTENGETVNKTYYSKTINVNGKSTTTNSESSTYHSFVVSDFGTNVVNLPDGSYTIKISRAFTWSYMKYFFQIPKYSSTATLTGKLIVDTTSPTISMKGYTSSSAVANGAKKNERVTFTASDTNFSRIYYKTPTSGSYTYTTNKSYTSGTTSGWYYVYAVDILGNRSSEYSIYYDNVKPTGTIYSNGTSVTSGTYVGKSFSYSASDSGSGIANLYYKTPTSGIYQQYSSGTIIPASAGDGWYYFYAVDNAGNQSATSSVYLETAAPLVEIYRNGSLAYSKSVTSAGTFDTNIYLNPNDKIRISCDTSSGKATCNYALDQDITIGSSYSGNTYTITLTTAIGIKANFNYHIVRSKPTIQVGGTTYQSGATLHLKEDTLVSWSCDGIIASTESTGMGISSEGGVNVDKFLKYTDGKSKTLSTPANTTTKYELTLNDRAGNESKFTVYIDKQAPKGEWRTGEGTLENGGYTNKPLSFVFTELGATATYSFNGGEYVAYTSGKSLTADGTYNIILTDLAGNKSNFSAHVDTVKPEGKLYANYKPVESGAITNENVYFTWDGEATATVNGQPYTKNTVLSDDGIYRFILTDLAGNRNDYTIEIDTVGASENMDRLVGDRSYTVSKWYVVEFDGQTKAFATYESALEYACQKEFEKSATSLELNDVEEFTQYHLVASRGNPTDDVRTGTYWRYKSQANAGSELYYFDRNLLDEVITFYAQNYLSDVKYFTLDDNTEYDELADNMYDNLWTVSGEIKAPCVNGFTFEQTDSTAIYAQLVGGIEEKKSFEFGVPFEEQFSVTGLYEITEVDSAGNTNIYKVFLDKTSATLVVDAAVFGEEQNRTLHITAATVAGMKAYYYKSFAIKQVVDNDPWVILKISNGGSDSYYTHSDELPTLSEGGEYMLTVYDRIGNTYSFAVYILGNEATVTFKPNSDNTAFDVTITLDQKFDTLVSLEIRRNNEVLPGVTTDVLHYTFDKAGNYTVTLRDNFGRVITRGFEFDKTLPNGTLEGVENAGRTSGEVTFTFDSAKYFAEVRKNSQTASTDKTGSISVSANGKYEIKLISLTDDANYRIFTFEIDTVAPKIQLQGSESGMTTNSDVIVSWEDSDVQTATYTLDDGNETEFYKGTKFSAEGKYTLSVIDDLGNRSSVTFTIDKTLEYSVIIDDSETIGVDTTNKTLTVINHEDLYVSVTKNGAVFAFGFGQTLSEEGRYSFRIYDDYGNTTMFTLVIDKSVEFSATTGNGVITNDDVVIAAAEKVNVFVTKDGKEYAYTLGSKLTEEGLYNVIIYDACGNEASMSFQIVKGPKTHLGYTLGGSVEILSASRDGEAVAVSGKTLNFTIDGTYRIVCKTDGQEYSFVLTLDTTAPTIELYGVANGGTSGKSVSIDNVSEEADLKVYKDGKIIDYELGHKLSEYGYYRVVVTDSVGNTNEYSFTLKYKLDDGIIALIVVCALAAVGGGVFLFIKKRKR